MPVHPTGRRPDASLRRAQGAFRRENQVDGLLIDAEIGFDQQAFGFAFGTGDDFHLVGGQFFAGWIALPQEHQVERRDRPAIFRLVDARVVWLAPLDAYAQTGAGGKLRLVQLCVRAKCQEIQFPGQRPGFGGAPLVTNSIIPLPSAS